jgi:hypothetical protein
MPENPDTISRFSAASIILPAVSHIGWAFVVETIVPAIFDLTIDVAMQPVPNTPSTIGENQSRKRSHQGCSDALSIRLFFHQVIVLTDQFQSNLFPIRHPLHPAVLVGIYLPGLRHYRRLNERLKVVR